MAKRERDNSRRKSQIDAAELVGVRLLRTLPGHARWIGRIAWSPDGSILASASADTRIRLWDADTGDCLRTLRGNSGEVFSVAFGSAGRILASGSHGEGISIWDLAKGGRLLRTLQGHDPAVRTVVFDSTGLTLATGGDDGAVRLWDAVNGRLLRKLREDHTVIFSVAFDPAGQTLATARADSKIKIWDVNSGNLVRTLLGHQGPVLSVAFDSRGDTLASASDDQTIKLWNPETGRLVRTLEGHTQAVKCVAYLWDGRILASRGIDDTIRLWRTDNGLCVSTIPNRTLNSWAPGIAFHPRKPILAVVGSAPGARDDERDRLIRLWELDLPTLMGQALKPSVAYTSAKVVLVGESNVGKSYLAHRMATGSPPEEGTIKSTHGMRFWHLEPERLGGTKKSSDDQRRDVVLWDMGGQEEYRLIHQLFLHDTTVALVLLDPTRGATAFKEVETWNKYLEKQLRGRPAVKLLVGSKVDEESDIVDRQGLKRLVNNCGFADYFETSAISGRGMSDFCDAVARAIDWEGLGKTSRPELFQRIREEIEQRQKRGEVVVHAADLLTSLKGKEWTDDEEAAVGAVTEQLATQGVLARSRVSSGEPVLVLQFQQIERYAGSLIVAARNNPRGVPALELRAVARADFRLPGIPDEERLPRSQERPVLECTVQMLLEGGICFQHEELLIFPSMFAAASVGEEATLPHAVSLYYDFAGAIDNIYASLVAWLVLARDFGRVRLWPNRAEFEVKDGGLCGLHKVARSGGFAHVDLYFETDTPTTQQRLFINFVEEHLKQNGVEIREHLAISCLCGHKFEEETLRQRIARSERDVPCPVCEIRHNLAEGAVQSRQRNPEIASQTWALKTEIEMRRQANTERIVRVIEKAADTNQAPGPIRLLHLSDLHFNSDTPIAARLQWLLDDLKQDSGGLGMKELDYLVISGDFTDKANRDGFEKALEFISGLTKAFGLSAERCILAPGNHDVVDFQEAYEWRKKPDGLRTGEWVEQGEIILARNPKKYPLRFKPFSDDFYHKLLQRPYPITYAEQGIATPFWETKIQFLTLNSCWQIDEFHRKRAGLFPESVAHAINEAQRQEEDARKVGKLLKNERPLRIGVWHHAVAGSDQMKDVDFLGNLQKNGVRIVLHGDVHQMQRDLIGYWLEKKIHVVGSGSFGARASDRPESTPRLYNVLEISRDLKTARVHTRCQRKPDGAWDGLHEWPDPDGGKGRLPYYDVEL